MSARSIWNTAFWPDTDLREWDAVDAFDDIRRILLDSLVLSKIDMEFPAEDMFRKPMSSLRIIPRAEWCPALIQNPRGPNMAGYWDDPVNRFPRDGIEIHFSDFFDWDRLALVDFQYYRVHIKRFDEHPHLAGRDALIEHQYVRVVFVEDNERSTKSLY